MIDDYFATLEDWKQLPAYKLETKIDSLVGFALSSVMEHIYGIATQALIPELPIRLGTIHLEYEDTELANRSDKVDFYIRTAQGENYFVEFKSDSKSRRESQDDYLRRAIDVGMGGILEGILAISKVSPYRKKYAHLLSKLKLAGLLDATGSVQDIDERIQLMYVQPHRLQGDDPRLVLDFPHLAQAIRACFPSSDFMSRFSSSLETWAKD